MAVWVERGAGRGALITDDSYLRAGAEVEGDPLRLWSSADLVLKVQPPQENEALHAHEADLMRPGSMLLCSLVPNRDLAAVERLAARGITAFSVERIPRTSRAQSMDVLSSMASLAGYRATLLAAVALPRHFPLLMTAAGTIRPARVFVVGAGVAGLQAIATARRLGALVEATDTRPSVREQVESLGARFVGLEADEPAQDPGGYASKMSSEFYRRQEELIARHCATADVVITTALVGGVDAPKLVTAAAVGAMRPGSVIVDLAAPSGGNCELSDPGHTIVCHGVTLIAPLNLPSEMPSDASLLLSRNLTAFVLAFGKDGRFDLDLEDEILDLATVTHEGRVRHASPVEAHSVAATP
jgi:NAD(P) transhydrogenase subunit alpha